MILVTGGTGLVEFIAVFDRIRKSRVEKIRAIEIRQLSKNKVPI
jgi:hypothetical protein